MTDLTDALRAERPPPPPAPLPGMVRPETLIAPKKRFTIERLQRVALWGAAAAATLLFVVLTSQSQVAENRIALILHRPRPAAAAPFDAQAETTRLGATLRQLSVTDDRIESRLAAVEQDVQDVTGSISKQLRAADESRSTDDGPSVAATAAVSASVPALSQIAAEPPPDTIRAATAAPSPTHMRFGIDIGSGLTIQALRLRWAAIRTAHPQFFEGLEPIISVKEIQHTTRIELRLIAGPIVQPGAAAALCSQLTLAGLYCQPTIFDGQHLALR
ncbi:MAG: hypothetical protein WBB34_19950 [Xanthobacteraceae bacterium]